MNNCKVALMFSISAVMILAFQNCGQQGEVALEGGPSLAKSSSDTMVVNPDGVNNDADDGDIVTSDDKKKSDDKEQSNEGKSAGSCSNIKIADLLLQVESVHANSADGIALEEENASISMNKLHITIRATKDIAKLKHIFMVLKDDGNKVLDIENLAHDLKTPSGQTAGIKVHLDSEISLKAGEIYSLQLSIDPEKQIISNPQKCLFRPVIKSARIVVALVDTIAM